MDSLLTGDIQLDPVNFDTTLPLNSVPNFTGAKPPFTPGRFALMAQVMGGINQAIGGYFQAQSQQYQARSQAVNLGYQADMAAINARQSEYRAESDIKSGQSQIANYTMQAGQDRSSTVANQAARGLRGGIGSASETIASMDLVKDINVYNINSNAVRAAGADRTQATNYQNQGNLDRVSAQNMNASANTISPFASGFGSLLTSASSVASNWNNTQRMKMYLANGGYMPGGFN